MDARLASFRTLHMSTKEIMEEFPDNQMIKQVMDGKKSMPSDPARRAIYEVQIARLQEKRARKEDRSPLIPQSAPNRLLLPTTRKRQRNLPLQHQLTPMLRQLPPTCEPTVIRHAAGASSDVATAAASVPPAKSPTPEEAAEASAGKIAFTPT